MIITLQYNITIQSKCNKISRFSPRCALARNRRQGIPEGNQSLSFLHRSAGGLFFFVQLLFRKKVRLYIQKEKKNPRKPFHAESLGL
jgi:hypothetical protein